VRRRNRAGSAAGWKLSGWKAVGLAGVVGVAATGVVIARAERRRRAYTPEEVRDRLRARHADAAALVAAGASPPDAPADAGGLGDRRAGAGPLGASRVGASRVGAGPVGAGHGRRRLLRWVRQPH
jgi:hypothetical protein